MAKITKSKLNLRQELFCKLYASDREFFGNGVESYVEAYNPKRIGNWYNSAKSSAFNLLTNTYILQRINEVLEEGGLNDAFVDKQLKFTLTQCANINAKIRAVNEYNKLKGRHAAEKVKFVDEYEGLTEEQIKEEIARRRQLRGSGEESDNKGETKPA